MQHRSPGAIAGGLAFGTMLGLMPKDSLLALCILALIAVLPVNQLIACLATIGLTFLESMTWGLTDWLGFHTLSLSIVSNLIGNLYQIPIAPWLRLENTVVMGSLILGSLLWGPCFLLTYRVSSRIQRSIKADEVAALAAAALRHQSINHSDQRIVFGREPRVIPTEIAVAVESGAVVTLDPAMELAKPVSQTSPPADNAANSSADNAANNPTDNSEDRILHETLIEVIRFKRPAPQQTSGEPQQTNGESVSPTTSSSETQSMHLTNFIRKDSAESASNKPTLSTHSSSSPSGVSMTQLHTQAHSKEDSLRNILKHIHTARESKREVERST
ncbi:MAG: hypothetical protein MUC43_09445 [Pirellula sp.]|nr:hypothetical protein [Pirellula sp.]